MPSWRDAGVVIALALVAPTGACTEDVGALALRLDLPEGALRPEAMTTVTVQTSVPGEAPREVTSTLALDEDGHGAFDVGEFEPAPELRLTVALRNAAGRLVGYGAAPEAIDLSAGKTIELPIAVRRPMLYVGDVAGDRLVTMDATRDTTDAAHQANLSLPFDDVRAVLAIDGTRVAVIADGTLQLIDTATHTLVGGQRAVPDDIRDAAVGPAGWIVIAHGDGVTAFDVNSTDSATLISGRTVDRVTVGHRAGVATVFALSDRVGPPLNLLDDCDAVSRAVAVPLAGGDEVELSSDVPLADVAASEDLDGGFAVDPCANAVIALDDGRSLGTVSRPSHLVASGGVLWAAGNHLPTIVVDKGEPGLSPEDVISGGYVQLVAIDPVGGTRRQIDLPAQSQVLSNLDDPANELSNILQADLVQPLDLAVLPANEGVAVLSQMDANTTALGNGIEEYIPAMAVTVYDMQLVDVATGSVSQRIRLACDAEYDGSNATFGEWQCAAPVAGTAPRGGEFHPTALGALYGAR